MGDPPLPGYALFYDIKGLDVHGPLPAPVQWFQMASNWGYQEYVPGLLLPRFVLNSISYSDANSDLQSSRIYNSFKFQLQPNIFPGHNSSRFLTRDCGMRGTPWQDDHAARFGWALFVYENAFIWVAVFGVGKIGYRGQGEGGMH